MQRTMVPLLLFLLLPESLAEQVCLNISNSIIAVNTSYGNIHDYLNNTMTCEAEETPCIFHCTDSEKLRFNGSSHCFDAKVAKSLGKSIYNLHPYSNCTIYLCNLTTISELVRSLHSHSADHKEMFQLFDVKDSCAELFRTSYELKGIYINVEREIIHNIMETSSLENGGSQIHKMKMVSLDVFNVSDADLSLTEHRIRLDASELLPENASLVPDIWLPVNALCNIPKEKRIIGLVTYMQHDQFQFREENITSMVIRIEVLQDSFKNLNPPIQMIFQVSADRPVENESRLQCHYFDETDLIWKTDGCETDSKHTDIVCRCNHATPFAVLLIRAEITEIHWKILSYLSYIGCGLSAFFTASCLVMYVFGRNHRVDYSLSIHVSLSGALFLLNVTFLLTEWGATVELDWVCVFVAAFMHYALLCCFTWMAIEALHLYLLLIKVFNTYYKHYLIKLSLAGWGIPGVIVAVSACLQDFKQFYGITEMAMADTHQTSTICWITDDSFFYSLNLVYFTLTFIFNSGILMAVASNICRMKQVFQRKCSLAQGIDTKSGRANMFRETCRSSLTVLGLTCLMGTTWGLAFLGSGYVNYPILYLFCILNSMQGFFIFLWVCLTVRRQRRRDIEERNTSAVKSQ